ncbi:carbohydrate ABC transporter permease [bacterium]|nr:carbohydrate ABC transporter permease [bacterium]
MIALAFLILLILNIFGIGTLIWIYFLPYRGALVSKTNKNIKAFFLYEMLLIGALSMLLPFYWMVITSFKDAETAVAFPPQWLPERVEYIYTNPETGDESRIRLLDVQRYKGQKVRAAPVDKIAFKEIDMGEYKITREEADPEAVIRVDPNLLESSTVMQLDGRNFLAAWYAPEAATRGGVNFGRYFWVSIFVGVVSTAGTLITAAFAAFAFAKMKFWGQGAFFYIVLTTMMVPGQVLLIPDFLILSKLGWLDTYLALIVPFLASVFTIFLMRQFFMTIPDDLWDAAQIDGAGRFRFLWQVVAPLSKPVFITAGIFIFLGSWNSLLWPLIVTSTPEMRTLMVGLQAFNEESGSEFQLLMAASTMAILPIVIMFFLLQRFFIQGIARTGLK